MTPDPGGAADSADCAGAVESADCAGPVESVESVVLLDEAGRAVGVAPKAQVHHARTPLHLAFSAYLFSFDGKLLTTRRSPAKATFPGVWTNSVCGHPAPGEGLSPAVRRRAATELGIRVPRLRLILPGFAYRAEMGGVVENERCPVYAGWLAEGVAVAPDPGEVAEVRWQDWSVFAREVLAGARPVSPWCLEQVRGLAPLGDEPACWPEGDPALLPAAARP